MTVERGSAGLASLAASAVKRHLAGDSTAMPDLVDRVTPLLWHVARGQGLDAALAEDVVQTTWFRLLQHADGLTDPQGVLKWLIITAKREAWAVGRRQRRDDPADTDDLAARPDTSRSVEETVVDAESSARLWAHFTRLPERCQQLLRLVAFSDRPDYQAVSEALDMPIGSIGPTRGRCLAKLRTSLASDPSWDGAQ
jgi:RNA polymerase sigma factor (sigma-70 family)